MATTFAEQWEAYKTYALDPTVPPLSAAVVEMLKATFYAGGIGLITALEDSDDWEGDAYALADEIRADNQRARGR